MSCIDVKHLSKSYGDTIAVDDVTFAMDKGRVFGFLGPNGAGKSTTIKMLTTLVKPTAGSVSVLGVDAIKNPLQVRHKIGVVLQQSSYEPTLSVEKALEKYGMMWGVPKHIRHERTESLLEEFGLTEIRNRRNEDLSIGQRRRVQVAREFIHDMDLLFLDEPTVGLDPNARRDLLDYLRDKVKTGLSIFYTTHILTEAEYLCDEIAIMNHGRLLEVDTPDALKSKLGNEKTIKIHLQQSPPNIGELLSNVRGGCEISFGGGNNDDDNNNGENYNKASTVSFDARHSDNNNSTAIHSKHHYGKYNSTHNRTTITIRSSESELVLLQILKILNDAKIEIEDLSAVPTSLEEIFLDMTDVNKQSKFVVDTKQQHLHNTSADTDVHTLNNNNNSGEI